MFAKRQSERRQHNPQHQQIAEERIEILFREAKLNPEYANRYVFLARKIAMKLNVKIPKEYKMLFCHKCYRYFNSKTVAVRTNAKTKAVEYKCKSCGHTNRYGYTKEQTKQNS